MDVSAFHALYNRILQNHCPILGTTFFVSVRALECQTMKPALKGKGLLREQEADHGNIMCCRKWRSLRKEDDDVPDLKHVTKR